jgi:hypothetical protein
LFDVHAASFMARINIVRLVTAIKANGQDASEKIQKFLSIFLRKVQAWFRQRVCRVTRRVKTMPERNKRLHELIAALRSGL